jgi:hypothetical protein
VLPSGFHRIRHYGLIANAGRRENLAQARALLPAQPAAQSAALDTPTPIRQPPFVCPACGAPMIVLEIFIRGQPIRAPPQRRNAP